MSDAVPTVTVSDLPDPLPPDLVVLDVREDDEWTSGRLDGARHVPLGQLPARWAEVPSDGQVLVYCKVGGRSARAVAFLQGQGVDAVNLDGGIVAWQQAGRGVVA